MSYRQKKRPYHIVLYFLLIFLVTNNHLHAQKTSVQATIQPAEIQIGEQALLNLKVIAPKNLTIQFPVYEHEIVPGLEVITMLPPDTVIENNVATMNFKYVVTSFDSTLYFVPHVPVFDGTDTIFSNSFGLKVTSPVLKDSTVAYLEKINTGQTDSIDFQQLQLNDIKTIRKAPFVWTDYLYIIWWILGILLSIVIIGFIVFMVLRKRNKGYFFTPPVVTPPHERALRELTILKEEKLWEHGQEKEYYVRITEVLRRYIHDRYRVNALEMTSGEIIEEITKFSDKDVVCEKLSQVLTVADKVKFAKYKPIADENVLSTSNALSFVNETKPEEVETDDKEKSHLQKP